MPDAIQPTGDSLQLGDNALDFGQAVTRYLVRNRSGATVYLKADAEAGLPDQPCLYGREISVDAPCTVLHVYVNPDFFTETVPLNGTPGTGVQVQGWAQDAPPQSTYFRAVGDVATYTPSS